MVRENGGANAQRGFNYQNCVISLVAIRNYKKPNFKIYVEADEDFEVNYGDDYHACIQVKGEKNLTFNKLLKGEKGKLSIFEKNLSSGKSDSVYKIVVFSFSRKDMESMQEQTDEEELFSNSWLLSNDQKNKVNNDRVENFSLVKTAFDNDMKNARIYLKGELVQQNIVVEGRAEVILNELFQQILQKSEKKVQTEQDKELKKITSKELDLILQKITAKARFEKELKNLRFN
ncbi:dsDNA nuclease domain-containing protein, partial [Staphylococcus aureus]|nr:dsDNA nuclease domain-containing protein [Staphylococcus aureus]